MIDDICDRIHHNLYDFYLEFYAQTLARQEICEDLSISICGSSLGKQIDPTLKRPIFYEALRRYKVWCSESLELSESERQTASRVPSWFFLKDRKEKWAEQLIVDDQPQTGNFRSEQVSDCLSHTIHNIQVYPQDEYRLICARITLEMLDSSHRKREIGLVE